MAAEPVADLKARYFDESARQIGVDETNDFIFGELHNALRQQLFDNLGSVAAAIPLSELPPSPLLKAVARNRQSFCGARLDCRHSRTDDLHNLLKLEAPLARAGATATRRLLPAEQVQHRAAADESGAHRRLRFER